MSLRSALASEQRVLILDDHKLFAEALELSLSRLGYPVRRLDLPKDGGTMATLRYLALRAHPSIVVLDLDLAGFGDGTELIKPLTHIGACVVVVTASEDQARWGRCIKEGACRVIPKSSALSDVVTTIERLRGGLPVMSRAEREAMVQAWQDESVVVDDMRRRLALLTRREREVLDALIEGHTVKTIARTDVVSEATVRTQVKSILAKLEVSSQLAAVGLANHANWRHQR